MICNWKIDGFRAISHCDQSFIFFQIVWRLKFLKNAVFFQKQKKKRKIVHNLSRVWTHVQSYLLNQLSYHRFLHNNNFLFIMILQSILLYIIMDFKDSQNLNNFSNFKLGSISHPDRPCSSFFKISKFHL